MIAEAIEKILGLGAAESIRCGDGREGLYLPGSKGVIWLETKQRPVTLVVSSLDEFAALARRELEPHIVVSVKTPQHVACFSTQVDRWGYSNVYAVADATVAGNYSAKWGEWRPAADLLEIILVQAADMGDRAAVLELLGNLRSEQGLQIADDGVTQVATVRQGITRAATQAVRNPVTLHPWETFVEIEQPPRRFVLRLDQPDKSPPRAKLMRIDDGMWEHMAKSRIAAFLSERGVQHVIW